MAGAYACATFFFHTSPEDIITEYESFGELSSGYLINMHDAWALVDIAASENEDWSRQVHLALALCPPDAVALTVVLFDRYWALMLTPHGQPGPMVVFLPDNERILSTIAVQLMSLEKALIELFPLQVDADRVDEVFGAVLEGVMPIDDALTEILVMLGCPADWLSWCWYEAIPRMMLQDPDRADRVTPLGEAKLFWEE